MHFRLFDRPLIVDDPLSRMYIDGQYEDYEPGSAYEGRVQIHGSVGKCKVEILEGNIPPGSYAYVDNVTKEVVVKWPKYTPPVETFTLLENGDFSEGDNGAWTNTGEGNPFVIEPDSDGQMSMKFKSGFGGGHYSESILAPVKELNRQITATGRIAQGKSSKRKLWGGIVLVFHDEHRQYLNHLESNWVNSGGGYKDVTVTAAPTDARTKYVSVRIHFDRKGQNHPGWADDIKWNHVWEKGYDDDGTHYVVVRVTDSLNNTATHRGNIEITGSYMISQLYPVSVTDSLLAGLPYNVRTSGKSGSMIDFVGAQMPTIVSVEAKSSIKRAGPFIEQVNAQLPQIASVVYQSMVKRVTAPAEQVSASAPTVASVTYKLSVKRAGNYTDSTRATLPTITGVTVT